MLNHVNDDQFEEFYCPSVLLYLNLFKLEIVSFHFIDRFLINRLKVEIKNIFKLFSSTHFNLL
jgi:hypothetical protein